MLRLSRKATAEQQLWVLLVSSLLGPGAAQSGAHHHPPTVCSLTASPALCTVLFMFLSVNNKLEEQGLRQRAGVESGALCTNRGGPGKPPPPPPSSLQQAASFGHLRARKKDFQLSPFVSFSTGFQQRTKPSIGR